MQRLADFLSALPSYHRYAFEFREPSWNCPETYRLLHRYNAAYCIFDLAGFQSPIEITADWTYVRLHGPEGKYQGSYTNDVLASWAEQIVDWSKRLNAIYVYFDNDQSAYAAQNAITLKRILPKRLVSTAA